MALRIMDGTMTLEIDNCAVATAPVQRARRSRRQRCMDRLDSPRPALHPRPGDCGTDSRRARGERILGQPSARRRDPRGAAMADRLIRLITAPAVVAVVGV